MTLTCSWDIGIKNLAYCIYSKNDNEIKKWDIINISIDIPIKCNGVMKNGQPCKAMAKFKGENIDNKINNYCGSHKSLYKQFGDLTEEQYIKNITTNTIGLCNKCKRKSIFNDMCRVHYNSYIKSIIKNTKLNPIKKKKCTSYDPQLFAINMYKLLDQIPELLQIDQVYIENQPCLKNPIMKSIGVMLFSYYVMKSMERNLNYEIKYVSASNKLKIQDIDNFIEFIGDDSGLKILDNIMIKYLLSPEKTKIKERNEEFYKPYTQDIIRQYSIQVLKLLLNGQSIDDKILNNKIKLIKKDEKMYDVKKIMGINYTKYDLRNTQWLDYLSKYKKLDDLCDAYLQVKNKE